MFISFIKKCQVWATLSSAVLMTSLRTCLCSFAGTLRLIITYLIKFILHLFFFLIKIKIKKKKTTQKKAQGCVCFRIALIDPHFFLCDGILFYSFKTKKKRRFFSTESAQLRTHRSSMDCCSLIHVVSIRFFFYLPVVIYFCHKSNLFKNIYISSFSYSVQFVFMGI